MSGVFPCACAMHKTACVLFVFMFYMYGLCLQRQSLTEGELAAVFFGPQGRPCLLVILQCGMIVSAGCLIL